MLLKQDESVRLFVMGGLGDDEQPVIGQASSPSFYGPYTMVDQPIVTPHPGTFNEEGALAPSVLPEAAAVRLWYFGLNKKGEYTIGRVLVHTNTR